MTDLEEKIIDLIKNNSHLSDELKARYILAMFLMDRDDQPNYLKLIEAFNYRCNAAERGVYIVKNEEKDDVLRTFDAAKEDILNKINSNH